MPDDLLLGSGALHGSIMASNSRFNAELDRLGALAKKKPDKMTDRELREIAKDFESLLVRLLLKEMRKTIPEDGFLEYSHATQMYEEMGDDALANQIAEQGGIGIGQLLYEQLKEARDELYSAQDVAEKMAEKRDQFLSIGGRAGEPDPIQFKPLEKNEDPATNAKPLQSSHDPIPLPQTKEFMVFEPPVIPLDRIERR